MADYRIAVIIGSFHKEICQEMLDVVRSYCETNLMEITAEVWVPGSMEKPLALKQQLMKPEIDGAVLLGIIEKGHTQHGLVMGQSVIKSIIDLQLEFMKPVGVGIMGPGIEPNQIAERTTSYAIDAVKALHNRLLGASE